MKNFRWWPVIGMVTAATAVLTGCGSGGGDSSSNASLRIANATLTHASLDLLVSAASAVTGTVPDTVSSYVSPASGSVTLQVNDTSSGTALNIVTPTLTGGNHYTLVAYEAGGAVKTVLLNEDFTLPAAGAATVRVTDAAVEAGKLDVYVIAGACTPANLSAASALATFTGSPPLSASLTQGVGSWHVCVTGQGSKIDLRMDMPVALTSQQVVTVLLTPGAGGQLLNGSLLVQQGAYSATRNPNTRVRLAAAVAGGTSVTATTGSGTVIDTGKSPALGFYTLVPATSTLNVTIGSGSSAAPLGTALTPGGDATLLVYGDATNPTLTLIPDDNRVPTDTTTAKLRLINGVTTGAGALTLTANSSPIGINVAAGAAAPNYATLQGAAASTATAVNFTLTSSTAGTFSPDYTSTLNTGATYTVMAGDGSGTTRPQLLIR